MRLVHPETLPIVRSPHLPVLPDLPVEISSVTNTVSRSYDNVHDKACEEVFGLSLPFRPISQSHIG